MKKVINGFSRIERAALKGITEMQVEQSITLA